MTEQVKTETVEFFDVTFAYNPDVSEFAIMEFAEAASSGQDGDTMEGAASLLRFVKELINPDDVKDDDGTVVGFGRGRFTSVARANRATANDLNQIILTAFGLKADRPTGRPSDSSDGPDATQEKSAVSSDVRISRFAGRPDLQLMVSQAVA